MRELKEVQKIKVWWSRLNLREQKLLIRGGISLGLLIICLIFFYLIYVKLDDLKENISDQKALLSWMQTAVPEIQGLRQSAGQRQSIPSGSLLTFVEQTLKQTNLSKALTTLEKSPDENQESVQLDFDKVSFDDLMTWLIKFWREYNITITQFSATRGSDKGFVQANIVISLPDKTK
jgi:type II secretory pathway component PulM